jgi:tetratricopeptide (TPR) repeat protein
LLFGAAILLVPVAEAWRERRQFWVELLAVTGPILLIGLGLMFYNNQRFGIPFEFGQHYQMSGERQVARQFFRLRYLWFNFRVCFLDPARWIARFPFVHDIVLPPLPADYAVIGGPFGILTNIPLAWLALAVPLTWRNRPEQTGSALRWFVMTVALLFGICALTLLLYESAIFRYEVDFLPPLLLLAVIGVLGLERALAGRPLVWRNAARCGWSALLVFSVAFNLLASTEHYAEGQNRLGGELFQGGNTSEAIRHYQRALWLQPDYAKAHYNLGVALAKTGKTTEAIEQYEAALRIDLDFAEAHNNLGVALMQAGRIPEAITHLHEALRLMPDSIVVHYSLGNALLLTGQPEEAIGWYEKALRIDPNVAKAHYNLGLALEQTGRLQDAISHYEQALRIQPDHAEARQRLDRLRAAH